MNRNTNGVIRRYLAKGASLDPLTEQEIRGIMDRLNTEPGKCPGFSTPNQVVFEVRPDVALAG